MLFGEEPVCDDYFLAADHPGLISWRPELKYLENPALTTPRS
jgi:hypothetical protein